MLILDKWTLFVDFTMGVQGTEDLSALHTCFYFVTYFIEDEPQGVDILLHIHLHVYVFWGLRAFTVVVSNLRSHVRLSSCNRGE